MSILYEFYFIACEFGRNENGSLFFLSDIKHTKDNPNRYVELRDVINFDDGMKTKFVIHGYLTCFLEEEIKVKDVTFKSERDVGRVVIVYWWPHNFGSYFWIAENTVPEIAEDLTKQLIHIQEKGNREIELVGHSLGAHIAGQAGRLFKLETGKEIDSIIGKVA